MANLEREVQNLRAQLLVLRARLDRGFSPETGVSGTAGETSSAGNCAAAALIVQAFLRGELVSANVAGQSHWFNRIQLGPDTLDVDLTADQFGLSRVEIATLGTLHHGTRVRSSSDVARETVSRAQRLAVRSGLSADVRRLLSSGPSNPAGCSI